MRRFCAFLCAILLGCSVALAQDPQSSDAPASRRAAGESKKEADKPEAKKVKNRATKLDAKDADKKAAEETKAKPVAVELKGDTVTLKSGAQLKGVQVISRTASEVEVEVGTGVRLIIPRRQIQDPILYDDIEPRKLRQTPAEGQKEGDIFPGNKLKPEVSDKLTAPMTEPLKYENTDLVKVLAELSQRLGVTIVVDDSVKALPEKERMWGFETTPGMNPMALLQDELLKKFPTLAVVYQYDKLLVTTKEKATQSGGIDLDTAGGAQTSPPVPGPAAPALPPPAAPQESPAIPPPATPPQAPAETATPPSS